MAQVVQQDIAWTRYAACRFIVLHDTWLSVSRR